MELNHIFPREIAAGRENNIPLVIVGGTVEYHGPHCSLGCDTLIAEGLVKRIAERRELIHAPSICYSPASWAVGGETTGTVHVEENVFEEYVYHVFMSLLSAGNRNIVVVIHHQFEQESLMPMTLCYLKAARRAEMAYLEKTRGQGWWGDESYSDYYENLGGAGDPFSWIKVIPAMSREAQNATGYDHAGKYECSLLMALYPDAVKLERLGDVKHWFTASAAEANAELGERMAALSEADLERRIFGE
ncbi:MAG: creatininase family protein [Clostridia bacterium]|nr:creatininase family protein [Clostridia bacterium]